MVDTPPSFLSAPPDGWKPRTLGTHNVTLFEILNEYKEKQVSSTHPITATKLSTPTTRRNQLLMSPDNFDLQDSNYSTSWRHFSPGETINNKRQQQPTWQQIASPSSSVQIALPFSVATINEELEATGKIAMMYTQWIRQTWPGLQCIQSLPTKAWWI